MADWMNLGLYSSNISVLNGTGYDGKGGVTNKYPGYSLVIVGCGVMNM